MPTQHGMVDIIKKRVPQIQPPHSRFIPFCVCNFQHKVEHEFNDLGLFHCCFIAPRITVKCFPTNVQGKYLFYNTVTGDKWGIV